LSNSIVRSNDPPLIEEEALTKGDLLDGAKENPVDAVAAGDVDEVDAGGFEGELKAKPFPAALGAGGDVLKRDSMLRTVFTGRPISSEIRGAIQ